MELSAPSIPASICYLASSRLPRTSAISERGQTLPGLCHLFRRVHVHEDEVGRPKARHLFLGNGEDSHGVEEARDLQAPFPQVRLHRSETALRVAGVERLE